MKPNAYDHERLGQLLRVLRPAPAAWVAKAKRIPLGPLTEDDLTELGKKLELEPAFRHRFDEDPVAATEAAGFRKLSAHMQRELEEFLAAPDEWLAAVPEVVAHGEADLPPEVRLRLLLLGTAPVTRNRRS
jgi:hypothetical protein